MGDEHPSKESLREVKREYKARQKTDKQRAKAAAEYWAAESGTPVRRRSPWKAAVAAVALVGLIGAAGYVVLGRQATDSAGAVAPSSSAPSVTGSAAAPTASATPDDIDAEPPVEAAFEGTPAAGWPVGAEGIRPPKAARTGIFSKVQVADAYRRTARYLEAALLDPRVVSKGKLQPVFDALGPVSTTYVKQQHKTGALDSEGEPYSWAFVANRFRPQDWKAAPEVRVKGRMTAKAKGDRLSVTFVYVAAYWLEPRGFGAARAVAVRRTGTVDFYGSGATSAGPMYFGGSSWTTTSGVCGSDWAYPNYLEAWVEAPDVVVASPATTPWDPTDVDAAPPSGTGCFRDTSGF